MFVIGVACCTIALVLSFTANTSGLYDEPSWASEKVSDVDAYACGNEAISIGSFVGAIYGVEAPIEPTMTACIG